MTRNDILPIYNQSARERMGSFDFMDLNSW